MNIEDIRDAILHDRFEFTLHANRSVLDDQITDDEIKDSVLGGEIIEDYPDDNPYPSCLIYGRIDGSYPVHTVWGYNAEKRSAVLITAYRPDPRRWIDMRIRR